MIKHRKRTLLLSALALALAVSPALAGGKEGREGKEKRGRKGGGHMLAMMDMDRDGMVSKVEMLTFFDAVDSNGDGLISKEEAMAHKERMKSEMKARREAMKSMSPEERFNHMDKNGDGSLDANEFRGPQPMFEKIDVDGNGSLSPKELSQAKGKMKGKKGKKEKRGDAEILE